MAKTLTKNKTKARKAAPAKASVKKAPVKKTAAKATIKVPKKVALRRHASVPQGRASAGGTGIAASAIRDRAIAHVKFSHESVNNFTKGFDRAQATAQAPGNPNHVVWTLGHLAS